jgi:hypothetical protein
MACGCKPARDIASESVIAAPSDNAFFLSRRRQAR